MQSFDDLIRQTLEQREAQSLLRRRVVVTPTGPVTVRINGRDYVNFCSNNYLGLTHHPRMLRALAAATATGAGAAGLISGHSDIHRDAEAFIAGWKHTPAALLMPSGYQANLAIVQTFSGLAKAAGKDVRFLIDKLAHASLLDAVRHTDARFRIYPHNGLAKLERLLADAPADQLQVVLTESIFSMDGDAANLTGIVALKKDFDFILVVDEAHGSGLYGEAGSGLVHSLGLSDRVDVSLVTLSKALGASGAAICGSTSFIQAIENFGRAYIYSTAMPPALARLASEAVQICQSESAARQRVFALSARVRTALKDQGWTVSAGDSPIIPIVLGDEQRSLIAMEALKSKGLLVAAVRPPTVPRGTSRLRVTVSAAHDDEQIEKLLNAMQCLSDVARAPRP